VNSELQYQLSRILHDAVHDPRVGLVTITRVVASGDLQHARVFISCLGSPAEQQATMDVLQRAKGFIRRELGQRIEMRYTPDLIFVLDDSIDRLLAMEDQLRQQQKPST